jgi:hypothetical protein
MSTSGSSRVKVCEANRFSVHVNPGDLDGIAELKRWVEWFESAGIPAVLVKTKKGFAVYREDMISVCGDID